MSPRRAPRAVTAILIAELVYVAAACVLTPWRSDLSLVQGLKPFLFPLALGLLLLATLASGRRTQILIVMATVPAALVLLPLEAWLDVGSRRLERTYTRRSQVPVIRLGESVVYPLLAPWDMAYGHRTMMIGGKEGLPLASTSKQPTGLCSANGSELVFDSDAHGFRNAGVQADAVKIAVIGDSFAQGYCVTEPQSISGKLRSRYGSVLNLAATGAGPLWELAILREYAKERRPRAIVWFFYEGNDLEGADVERSGYAGKYLDPNFTQDLGARQKDVDAALGQRLDSLAASFHPSVRERLTRLILLREIRARLALSLRPSEARLEDVGTSVHDEVPVLKQVLSLARVDAAAWGGELLFVYLPERSRYTSPLKDMIEPARPGHQAEHAGVIAAARSLGLDILDMEPVFSAHSNPLSFFDEGRVHYNAEGYALVADSVGAAISRMGIKPATNTGAANGDRWIRVQQPSLVTRKDSDNAP